MKEIIIPLLNITLKINPIAFTILEFQYIGMQF